MDLNDARAVKADLLGTTRRRVEESLETVGGITTRRLDAIHIVRRSVAFGVAPAADGYRVAVRLQRRELSDQVIEEATAASAGEVDVRYVGRIAKFSGWRGRIRPLRIGSSVGHFAITAGTLGAFVRKTGDDRMMVLSNNHVLADENAGQPGDMILQPGAYDHGTPADRIGVLAEFVPLDPKGPNVVDAAIAAVDPGVAADVQQLGDGQILLGMADSAETCVDVSKTGRTTGYTTGRVTAFELDNVVVAYDIGNVRFDDQIEIEGADAGPFSQGGDSGSLIVCGGTLAFALLFAGGDQGGTNGMGLTYANPLGEVMRALDVSLAT